MAPGYVVRKPLGAVGDAGSLPYAPSIYRACGTQRGAASRRRGMGAPLRHATPRRDGPQAQAQAQGRCWAWRFERDRRAFEYGAHDYGIGDRTGFHSANVRQREWAAADAARGAVAAVPPARFSARSDCLFSAALMVRSWADVVDCREGSRKRLRTEHERLIVLMIMLMIAAIIP